LKIYIDDELRFQVMPNRAVELNPGTYRFRFVAEGKPEVEQEIVLGEAEKFRTVTIRFSDPAKLPESGPSVQQQAGLSTTTLPPRMTEERPIPLASYIFAGVAIVGGVNFAAWGLSSKSLVSNMEDNCAPDCQQTYIDRARTRALVADVSLGIGVASLATATVIYFLRPAKSVPVEVDVGILPRGGVAASVQLKAF
jgi:hypothetical protein